MLWHSIGIYLALALQHFPIFSPNATRNWEVLLNSLYLIGNDDLRIF